MGQINWSKKASSNLQAIHAYIARDSNNYATRFIKDLVKMNRPRAGTMFAKMALRLAVLCMLALMVGCTQKSATGGEARLYREKSVPSIDKTILVKRDRITIPLRSWATTKLSPDGRKLLFESVQRSIDVSSGSLTLYQNGKVYELLALPADREIDTFHWLDNSSILLVTTTKTGGVILGYEKVHTYYKVLTLRSGHTFELAVMKHSYLSIPQTRTQTADLLLGNTWQNETRNSRGVLEKVTFSSGRKSTRSINRFAALLIKSFKKSRHSAYKLIPDQHLNDVILVFERGLWLCRPNRGNIKITRDMADGSGYDVVGWEGKNIFFLNSNPGSPLYIYDSSTGKTVTKEFPRDIREGDIGFGNYANGRISFYTWHRLGGAGAENNVVIYSVP